LLKRYAGQAPKEIRSDLETFAAAFTTYAKTLQKAGYKAGSSPTTSQITAIANAAKTFGSPKLRAAEQHLSAWAHKNCGSSSTP
jgi:hypothetical protein